MTAWRVCCAAILLVALSSSEGLAAKARAPSLNQALSLAGDFTVPVAWAGIWTNSDTNRVCGNPAIDSVQTTEDTLCAGEAIVPGGVQYTCSGTVTDTDANLTCNGSFSLEGCTADYRFTLQATRNGNTAFAHTTQSVVYTPPMCILQPDSCDDDSQRLTRTGPPPLKCATPTLNTTWGKLKLLYR